MTQLAYIERADCDVSATLHRILKEHGRLGADLDILSEHDNLSDAGMTSHARVDVMLALEDEFGVEFPDEMLSRGTFDSVASLRCALSSLLSAA